jgi:Bifunctional DNA primase/polymerase, N-terminal
MTNIETITKVIVDNQLYVLPLYSIQNGHCSCGKPDCSSPGKHPLFRYNWKIIASNKPEKIKDWFSAYKKMNFGLATGRYSKATCKYLIVIDVDAATHSILQELPQTFSYRTGSGGWHLWFWSPYPIKNSVCLLDNKVDVRGTDGYVVIPPSNHCKGSYNAINLLPIADLPKDVISKLLAGAKNTPAKTKKQAGVATKPKSSNPPANIWTTDTVETVRKLLLRQVVPEGVRNVVMHRLLSSDRARGALKPQLRKNAKGYLACFTKPQEFAPEVDTIIESVLKYPAYNNCHEKINELYVAWLKKNRRISLTPAEVKSLDTHDVAFFASLKASDIKVHRCTLQQVLDARMAYMKTAGLQHISNYKQQLLAKKLMEMGFKRTRTAKGNWWNVFVPNEPPPKKQETTGRS